MRERKQLPLPSPTCWRSFAVQADDNALKDGTKPAPKAKATTKKATAKDAMTNQRGAIVFRRNDQLLLDVNDTFPERYGWSR